MAYSVEYTDEAIRNLKKLDRAVSLSIVNKIDSIRDNPLRYTTLIVWLSGISRMKFGDYRVFMIVDQNKILITVVSIGHRRSVSKDVN